jgi:hypothetical protein
MNKCRLAAGLFLWTVFGATGEGQTSVDLRTQSKSVDFSGAGSTKPMQTGSSLPATCAVGQFFFLTTAPAGSNVYACNPANTWGVEGNSLSVTSNTANEVLSSNGSGIQWLALGGDISGAPGGLTVNRLQGRNLSNTAPSSGQVLQWNAAANQWQPAPAQAGNSSYAFAAQVSVTIPGTVHQFGTANLVVDCYDNSTPPQRVEPDKIQISPTTYNVTVYFSTAQTGYCVVNGAGTASVSLGGGAVSSVFGRTGAVMAQTGDYTFGQISGSVGSSQLPGAGGDVSGTLTAATVAGIQNRAVASTAPANGQALLWNSGASAWQPGTVSGGGAVSTVFGRTGAVTAQAGDYTAAQVTNALSQTGSYSDPSWLALTWSGGRLTGIPSTFPPSPPIYYSSGNVGIGTAAPSQPLTVQGNIYATGNITCGGTCGGTGGGAVSSIFGRTGAVTAQTGDYGFGQISGTVASGQLPGAGGDLGGTLTSATVKAIQGQPVSSTLPGNGQALVWNSSAGAWLPSNVSGSGSGVTMAYQLGDLAVARTSSTVLSIAAGCTSSSPCNVRFGYQVYSITNSATATISGSGNGTAYVYVNGSGILMVGHNLTVACSAGCTQQAGITSFPPNVLPVYTWTASNGTWNNPGGTDQRAFLSAKTLAGGQGIVITEAPGQSTLAVDNGVIPTYLMNSATLNFPSIATGTCAADQTITVAGANPGDAIAPGWPALPGGVFGIMLVSGTNTVTIRLCNLSGIGVTPPSATYRATIVRNY